MTQPPNDPNNPPPTYGSYGQQPAPGQQQMSAKGFFGALFDFRFNHFITPKIASFAYILAMVLIGLGLAGFLIAALVSGDVALILLTVIFGPLVALLYLILVRITMEFYVALIRMSEDIHQRLPQR